MTAKLRVSVIVPTFRRAHLLGYVLDGLRKQSYGNFEVIVVLKPSRDGTEEIVKKYEKWLNSDLVLQSRGYVVDALNLGLERASGDIIAFLDDDAIPSVDWVQRHVESYEKHENVGGVAGNVIPARLCGDKPIKLGNGLSHVVTPYRSLTFFERVFGKVGSAPLDGMDDYLVYISKAGVVEYNVNVSRFAWHRTVRSLLGMGANMSVLREAVKGFKFPEQWILGLAWEQFLGWHLWRKGYNLIFNPEARVYHVVGHETLTRDVKNARKDLMRWVENYLLFYRLYSLEPKLSRMHRIAWLIYSSLTDLKKLCWDKEIQQINRLKGLFYSELVGQKWLISKRTGGNYTPIIDFENIIKNEK